MSHDPLDYGLLIQDALRGVVRRSLEIVAAQGMPGEHHFYLTFSTQLPDVMIPPHLLESYPEEMTIVLKTQFQDLVVDEDAFSVGLFFSGKLHHLVVPFYALRTFTDPSAELQLTFQPAEPITEEPAEEDVDEDVEGEDRGDNVVSIAGFQKRRSGR
ncbi:MAG: ClpXP protease specificity-enhancing factor SspB [Acidobacteriota bacterium]